jgi:hypothetical protein
MSATDRIRLMMDMDGGIVRVDRLLIDIRFIEVKYTGLAMIDPDNGMVMGHGFNPCEEWWWQLQGKQTLR